MRPPQPAPRIDDTSASALWRLQKAHPSIGVTDGQGRYLPWDELRHRPQPEGLTTKEAWILTGHTRRQRAVEVPLIDTAGRPFRLTEFNALSQRLHYLTRRSLGAATAGMPDLSPGDSAALLLEARLVEPWASAQLSGADIPFERAKTLIEQGAAPANAGEQTVANIHHGMMFIQNKVADKLSPAMLEALHRVVIRDPACPQASDPFRQVLGDADDGGAPLWPRPEPDTLPWRVRILCAFANADPATATPFLDPLVRAMLLQFIVLHDAPFARGNGRIARLLFYWYALKHGYGRWAHTSVSQALLADPPSYRQALLHSLADHGDATLFVLSQANAMAAAIDQLDQFIQTKFQERHAFKDQMRKIQGERRFNERQIAILEDAANTEANQFTIQTLSERFEVAYLTARKDLDQLVAAQFLERNEGRPIVFKAAPKLRQALGLAGPS